jgi:hypothetical protein
MDEFNVLQHLPFFRSPSRHQARPLSCPKQQKLAKTDLKINQPPFPPPFTGDTMTAAFDADNIASMVKMEQDQDVYEAIEIDEGGWRRKNGCLR